MLICWVLIVVFLGLFDLVCYCCSFAFVVVCSGDYSIGLVLVVIW